MFAGVANGCTADADSVLAELDRTLTPHVLLPPGRGSELQGEANTLAATLTSLSGHLGEFGATLFIARPDTVTVPVAIFRLLGQPGAANFATAMALA